MNINAVEIACLGRPETICGRTRGQPGWPTSFEVLNKNDIAHIDRQPRAVWSNDQGTGTYIV